MSWNSKLFTPIAVAFLFYFLFSFDSIHIDFMKALPFVKLQTFPRARVSPAIKSIGKMASTAAFLETTKNRRTYYQINNETTIPDSRLQEIVKHTILHVPSAFNSQATRLVVLLKKEHQKLWDIALDACETKLPETAFKHTEQRLKSFRAAYGTVRFSWRIEKSSRQLIANNSINTDSFLRGQL